MKNNTKNSSSKNSAKVNSNKASKASTNKAMDNMEKQIAKAERLARIEANKAKRLKAVTSRFEALKAGKESKGFANQTINNVRTNKANEASVQGAIDSLNKYIKQTALVNGLSKDIIAALKGQAAQAILANVNGTTLPLYIDNRGEYKVEALYRLVASKAQNKELRTILNNVDKANK